jgi:EpsD family peptidyl-prolyl cis-trans isomerase
MPIETAIRQTKKAALCVVVLATALAGCSKQTTTEKPSGQVVANVNGVEITYLQLNHLLQTTGASAATEEGKQDAVNALVDRELLVQEALEAKLDRDAEVLQSIDAARRQILIDAYAQRMILPQAAISDADKKTYYKEHPELFQDRRVYDLTVFTVSKDALLPAVMNTLDGAKTVEATREILDAQRVKYMERKGEQSAEQLPFSVIKQFAAAGVGDILIVPQGDSANLMQITEVAVKPVQFADAAGMIEQYLTSTRNSAAMQARVKQLREGAHIAFADEFAVQKPVVAASTPQ